MCNHMGFLSFETNFWGVYLYLLETIMYNTKFVLSYLPIKTSNAQANISSHIAVVEQNQIWRVGT